MKGYPILLGVGIALSLTHSPATLAWAATAHSLDAADGSPVDAVFVDNDGKVGIGTTGPVTKLDFGNGVANVGQIVNIYTSGNVRSGIGMDSATAGMRFYGSSAEAATTPIMAWGTISSVDGTTWSELMRLQKNGHVGIGTTSPDATTKLHVAGAARVDGDLTVAGNLAAKYQDVAEWVVASRAMNAGMVAILDSAHINRVQPSQGAYDTRVAGVISAQPGLLLGEPSAEKVKVATTGRVKVRATTANGPIAIGDLLVTSEQEGMAMRSAPIEVQGRSFHQPGTVLGKALEPLAEGEGEILVLLTLQ